MLALARQRLFHTRLYFVYQCVCLSNVLCVASQMAVSMGDAGAKKLAIYTMIVNQIMVVLMQFYKPSGTGAEGSPEMGPLPLMIGLMVPSFVGAYVA